VLGKLLTGALVMSEKQINKIKDRLEVFTLVSIFLVSLLAVSPSM